MAFPNCYSPSALETIQCCFKSCEPKLMSCLNEATKMSDPFVAQDICYEMDKQCQDVCRSIPSKGLNIVRECALEACGDSLLTDPDCLNKESVVACCQARCLDDVDCAKCSQLYDHFVAETVSPRIEGEVPKKRDRFWWIVLTIFFFLLVILEMKFLVKSRRKK